MIGLAVVGLIAAALLTDIGNGSDRGSSPEDSGGSRQATSTVVPPDVDEARTPVDLARTPAGDDPVELARWWAATYTAYIGVETPDVLAERLAPQTTERLRAELAALPLAASYDAEPAEIQGVSGPAPVTEADRARVRVTVETVGALTTYDLALVAAADSGAAGSERWLVDEATRLQ